METSTTEQRLRAEMAGLSADPVESVSFVDFHDDNVFLWDVIFEGPAGGIHEKCAYIAQLKFSDMYPTEPPSVTFVSSIYHPNIGRDNGMLCTSFVSYDFFEQDDRNMCDGENSDTDSAKGLVVLPIKVTIINEGELEKKQESDGGTVAEKKIEYNVKSILESVIYLLDNPEVTEVIANESAFVMYADWASALFKANQQQQQQQQSKENAQPQDEALIEKTREVVEVIRQFAKREIDDKKKAMFAKLLPYVTDGPVLAKENIEEKK